MARGSRITRAAAAARGAGVGANAAVGAANYHAAPNPAQNPLVEPPERRVEPAVQEVADPEVPTHSVPEVPPPRRRAVPPGQKPINPKVAARKARAPLSKRPLPAGVGQLPEGDYIRKRRRPSRDEPYPFQDRVRGRSGAHLRSYHPFPPGEGQRQPGDPRARAELVQPAGYRHTPQPEPRRELGYLGWRDPGDEGNGTGTFAGILPDDNSDSDNDSPPQSPTQGPQVHLDKAEYRRWVNALESHPADLAVLLDQSQHEDEWSDQIRDALGHLDHDINTRRPKEAKNAELKRIKDYDEMNDERKAQRKYFMKVIRAGQNELIALRDAKKKAEDRATQLEELNASLDADYENVRRQAEDQVTELEGLNAALSVDNERLLSEWTARLAAGYARVVPDTVTREGHLATQLEVANAQLREVALQRDDLQADIRTAAATVRECQERNGELDAQIQQANNAIRQLTEDRGRLQDEVQAAADTIHEHEMKEGELNAQIEEANARNDELTEDRDLLRAEVDRFLQAEHDRLLQAEAAAGNDNEDDADQPGVPGQAAAEIGGARPGGHEQEQGPEQDPPKRQ